MRKIPVNISAFFNEDDISFYLLGAFISDGNVSFKDNIISICSKDIDWLSDIRNIISLNREVYKRSTYYEFRFRETKIKDWLISYGCTPHKSKTVNITKNIPNKYTNDFLRGVIDGDGCICISTNVKQLKYTTKTYQTLSLYITSGSELFAHQLQSMIESKNHSCSVYMKHPKEIIISPQKIVKPTTYWSVQCTGLSAQKLLKEIYYTNNKLSLKRKQEKVFLYCQ